MTLVNPITGISYFLKQVAITSKLSISGLWFAQRVVLESSWWHFKCWTFEKSRESVYTLEHWRDSTTLNGHVYCNKSTNTSLSSIWLILNFVGQVLAVWFVLLQNPHHRFLVI